MRNRVYQPNLTPEPEAMLRLAERWAGELVDPSGSYRALSEMTAAVGALAELGDAEAASRISRSLRAHPLMSLLRRDPLLARAWTGVGSRRADDPRLTDLMLRHPECEPLIRRADTIGRNLYETTSALPACEGVRDCRRLIARTADALAEQRHDIEVLGIAPGFMREAERAQSGPAGGIRRWVGLVSDPADAQVISRALPLPWVLPYVGNTVATLLRQDLLGSFDLVYCKAIDQLSDGMAETVAVAALARTRHGGRLLLAGRCAGASDLAFWALGGGEPAWPRDEAGMSRIAAALPPAEVARRRLFRSVNEDAMIYLEVERA